MSQNPLNILKISGYLYLGLPCMFCEESVEKILKCKRCPAFPEQVCPQLKIVLW